jgi:cytidine deaminase
VTDSDLLVAAEKAAERAYCPYSDFPVGAAVLASTQFGDDPKTWRVFSGCNVENVSYGLTVCAERVAVMNAVSAGFPVIHRVAVWAKNTLHHAVTPCGACRQVLAELMPHQTGEVIMATEHGFPRTLRLSFLLPEKFSERS